MTSRMAAADVSKSTDFCHRVQRSSRNLPSLVHSSLFLQNPSSTNFNSTRRDGDMTSNYPVNSPSGDLSHESKQDQVKMLPSAESNTQQQAFPEQPSNIQQSSIFVPSTQRTSQDDCESSLKKLVNEQKTDRITDHQVLLSNESVINNEMIKADTQQRSVSDVGRV